MAHTVGLKQTIFFPFVVGELNQFCDALMAGRNRMEHSEIGSSFIHFNYTPHEDKATASLIGDVPRGVMLDQPPIFGRAGGIVGPVRMEYGTVLAAGHVAPGCAGGESFDCAAMPRAGCFRSRAGAVGGRCCAMDLYW